MATDERDGYGRCRDCGLTNDHTETCRYRREWRPLLMNEYPAPGPTKTGLMIERDGVMVRPIFVYARVEA